MEYKVIGPVAVGGVEPGGTVTEEQLAAAGATDIPALIGPHLEPVKPGPRAAKKTQKDDG